MIDDELIGNSYDKLFISASLKDLKSYRICYVYKKEQIKYILQEYPDAYVQECDGYWTISIEEKLDGRISANKKAKRCDD